MRRLREELAADAGYSIVAGLLLMAVLTTSFLVKGIGRPLRMNTIPSTQHCWGVHGRPKVLQCAPYRMSMQDVHIVSPEQEVLHVTKYAALKACHSGVTPVRLPHGPFT